MTAYPAYPAELAEPRARLVGEDAPWAVRDLRRAVVGGVLALALLALCWFGASGEALLSDALIWLAGATGAVALFGVCAVAWMVVGLRRVRILRREVLSALRDQQEAPLPPRNLVDRQVLVGSQMTKFHLGDCGLTARKTTQRVGREEAVAAGLAPCPVCAP